ncbi:phage portal protein [Bombella pollinis]|uniref:Phage portal protein n=1 Tax=Bombella pollinis TaxID=2967337 RepID=A0ABT3WLY7_9PROT|nr:phage portal protein [Bombella pollinis]MCX5619913.1 phage portal protein [Bombella pollinis]
MSGNMPFNSHAAWATPRLVGQIEAGRVDRFGSSWVGTPTTPDEQIRIYGRILIARSRDMAINDPYMRGFVRKCRANIIGHGVKLRCLAKKANGKEDGRLNGAVVASWVDWCKAKNCDVTGREGFVRLCLTVTSSLAVDGEAFVHIVQDGPYGIQLQHIDAVRCPHDYDVDENKGTYIRAGIEYDRSDRVIAYYFLSDDSHGSYYGLEGQSYIRVPAENICHVYRQEQAGQKRGFPWATSALYRLKNLKEFEDNAALNARVGAAKMGLVTWDDDAGPERPDDDRAIHFTSEAGTFLELPTGANLEKWDPAFPDQAFGPFIKSGLRAAAAGMGVGYNSLANDLEGVNFSSIRAGMLDERELWKEEQHLVIEQLIEPIFDRFIRLALLSGKVTDGTGYVVPPTKLESILRASSFHPRRWDWVDPKSDVVANQKAMDALIKSPQQVIRERGQNPEDVLDDWASWAKACEARGIPKELMQVAFGEQVKTAVTDEPDNDDE